MAKCRVTDLTHTGSRAACSVLIATYNRPGPLSLILTALNIQTVRNFEVIVCDDGSGPETLATIKSISPGLNYTIRYIRHEDMGFRKALILNRGILASRADYLLFIDDDCLPHSRYVESHLRKQQPATLVFGKFVKIRQELVRIITADLIQKNGLEKRPFLSPAKKTDLVLNRLRFYKHLLLKNPLRPKLYGANFSVDKTSLYAVNGFNEEFEGWGYEDNELRWRLINNGVRMREAITSAIVFHLDLREQRKTSQYLTGRANKDLFLKLRNEKWASRGLSDHEGELPQWANT